MSPVEGEAEADDGSGTVWCDMPPFAHFSYWGDDEATRAAWRGSACTVGDLGRLDEAGYLYLTGRRLDLIISGGVNVYPAEVEAVLAAVPGLRELAVFGLPDEQWGQRVCVAYVADPSVDEASLRSVAEARLAPYKRPKLYVRAAGPATHRDRQALAPRHSRAPGPDCMARGRRAVRIESCHLPPSNPATGQIEKTFDTHTPAEVEALIQRAVDAFGEYRHTTFAERARHLITAAELLEGEVPDIARILTTEMGKTFAAARGEVSKCALGLRWFAEHAEALLADEPIATGASRSYVHYQPIGPVLAIMPWNFPMWQVVRFAAPALMVGNVGLLKHASNVPQTALVLEDLFRRAGLPEGVFTNLFVESKDVAKIIEDPRIAAVTLTGSERAGMSVGCDRRPRAQEERARARWVRPVHRARVRRHGDDRAYGRGRPGCRTTGSPASPPSASSWSSRWRTSSCAASPRPWMRWWSATPSTPPPTSAPSSPRRNGPSWWRRSRTPGARGRRCTARDRWSTAPGWYFPPTVLSGITSDMRVAQEELFGPVAMVERVPDLTAALEVANATTFGLGSSVWTTDEAEIQRCIEELEAGAVFVNAMVASTPELPFGGIKRSGFGRELSELGLKEFCNAKTVWIT